MLAKKKASMTSESGRTFHVWEISDLRPGSAAKSISLFLFGDAAANAYKVRVRLRVRLRLRLRLTAARAAFIARLGLG